jgi:trehalose 6-phosphate synthase/phosphatase
MTHCADRVCVCHYRAQLRRETAPEQGKQLLEGRNKLIVCANRRPVKLSKNVDNDAWVYTESDKGMVSALKAVIGGSNVWWVSWPGTAVEKASQEGVRRRMESEHSCTPVFLPKEVQDHYYDRFCCGVLWPLLHSLPINYNKALLEGFAEQFDAYTHANQLYVDAVASVYEEGDYVIVYDYELLLLPALLRKRISDVKCGFFLYCPFPSIEFYSMAPVRENLLRGMLGADLVSFNHFDYVRHFLNACTRIMGLESYPSRVEHNGRLISVTICPAGINPQVYKKTPETMVRTKKKRSYSVWSFMA